MRKFFAVVDDQHDAKNPVTVVRVSELGSVHQLTEDAAWAQSTLLERIEAGAVPYRLRPITEKAAARVREGREKKVAYRYSIIVADDDPTDTPVGVLREWGESPSRSGSETYSTRSHEWVHSYIRMEIDRANSNYRLVPSDSSTVHQFVEARRSRR